MNLQLLFCLSSMMQIGMTRAFSQLSSHAKIGRRGPPSSSARLSVRRMASYGEGMSQEAMMESDLLIPVDQNDVIISGTQLSKRQGHSFSASHPRAFLHRAFSFFLFDEQGRLLLTQRAKSKITFPSVWTNTCCSHPLVGMSPDEVDDCDEAYPEFPGIKHAAIRKCRHELGIPPVAIAHDGIRFITRFHYWAADTRSYGRKNCPWGEHEVDYILFYQLPPGGRESLGIQANPEEVSDYKYVTAAELRTMMADPDLLWSPWFLGIMEKGGWTWWNDLANSMQGKYTNKNVVFFDPPKEHFADFNLPSHDRVTGIIGVPDHSSP